MRAVPPILQDMSVAFALLLVLLISLETGFRIGRRAARQTDTAASAQIGAIQGAILGLLGFSFAAAGARFIERQDLIVQEANAIGTAYLRADLLDEPFRSELRSALKSYTEYRVDLAARGRYGLTDADTAAIEQQHARMWRAAIAGVANRPATMVGVLPPLNDVIDLHSTRLYAGVKHLPTLVMALLIASSMLSVGVIGYGYGGGGHRRAALTVPLAVVIAVALWITIDLDRPRAGLIQLNDAPLESLKFGG
jgi:hypothetical protein